MLFFVIFWVLRYNTTRLLNVKHNSIQSYYILPPPPQ